MKRNHTLSEKLPLLSMLLSIAATSLACVLASSFSSSEFVQYLLISAAGILCMLAQKWWFAPAFKGVFRAEVPLREIGLLCVPFLIQLLLSWLLNVMDHGLFFRATALSVVMALSAGFGEEAMFRGLAVPIGMRYLRGRNKILITALVTSVVFGLSHLGNAKGGNVIGIVQAVASIGSGLFYAAVFLRSGSICVPVLMHTLYDWMYFVTNPALQNGEMANMGVTTAVIISCVVDLSMSAVGLWLIRPAVREKIEAVWQDKWDFADSDDGTDIGEKQYQPKHLAD
jgi:membrane protease YdiL (CAAX protease family)